MASNKPPFKPTFGISTPKPEAKAKPEAKKATPAEEAAAARAHSEGAE